MKIVQDHGLHFYQGDSYAIPNKIVTKDRVVLFEKKDTFKRQFIQELFSSNDDSQEFKLLSSDQAQIKMAQGKFELHKVRKLEDAVK